MECGVKRYRVYYLSSPRVKKFYDIKWNEIKEVSSIHKLSYKIKVSDFENYYKKECEEP